jgi:hypothetical protein
MIIKLSGISHRIKEFEILYKEIGDTYCQKVEFIKGDNLGKFPDAVQVLCNNWFIGYIPANLAVDFYDDHSNGEYCNYQVNLHRDDDKYKCEAYLSFDEKI